MFEIYLLNICYTFIRLLFIWIQYILFTAPCLLCIQAVFIFLSTCSIDSYSKMLASLFISSFVNSSCSNCAIQFSELDDLFFHWFPSDFNWFDGRFSFNSLNIVNLAVFFYKFIVNSVGSMWFSLVNTWLFFFRTLKISSDKYCTCIRREVKTFQRNHSIGIRYGRK